MRDTKENMEKRVVTLASSGVIGYYIFSKLNAAQDAVDVPEDGLVLPPALKEATFYEGGLVSVESVKRMSEIIAEQARVYAATIRNGIRTPIVVEDEQPEIAEEEYVEEDVYVEDEPVEENDTEIFDENVEPEVDADVNMDEDIYAEPAMDVDTDAEDVDNSMFDDVDEDTFAAEEVAEDAKDTADMFAEPSVEEPADIVMDESAVEVQTVFVPVAAGDVAPANVDPVTFEEMGGFAGVAVPAAAVPVAAVPAEDGMEMPFVPVTTLPQIPEFETPTMVETPEFVDDAPLAEEPVLMDNVEPLHKVEEEEEDPRNKEQFKSIADFLNTL